MTLDTERTPTLVLGGTGKTGRRVAKRLTARRPDSSRFALGRAAAAGLPRHARDAAATGVWKGTSQ